MKKFVSGLLSGLILAGTVAFAASYLAEPATFKVLVNGEEFVSDPPALVVEGRTYLPLRAMGDALGVPVNWNEELGQAEVGTTFSYVPYKDFTWCPDFGKFLGIEPVTTMIDRNRGVYVYEGNSFTSDELVAYYNLLETNGLQYVPDDNKLTMLFSNPDSKYSVVIKLDERDENLLDIFVFELKN